MKFESPKEWQSKWPGCSSLTPRVSGYLGGFFFRQFTAIIITQENQEAYLSSFLEPQALGVTAFSGAARFCGVAPVHRCY